MTPNPQNNRGGETRILAAAAGPFEAFSHRHSRKPDAVRTEAQKRANKEG